MVELGLCAAWALVWFVAAIFAAMVWRRGMRARTAREATWMDVGAALLGATWPASLLFLGLIAAARAARPVSEPE